MTGYDIYKRAMSELCLETSAEDSVETLPTSALNTVNDIGSDLINGFHIDNIFEDIDVSPDIIPTFTYGIAMLAAALYGDSAKNAFFTELYNHKRSAAKSSGGHIKNTIPIA